MGAYVNFCDLGPERVYVESTLKVLRAVRDGFAYTEADRVAVFDEAIRQVESSVT
jgi:hypothetical protein